MYRHHLEKLVRTRLDDVLVDEGMLDRSRLEAAQADQDRKGCLLSDVLIDSETIDEWELAKLVASHYALPFVDVQHYSIPGPVLDLLPLEWCRKHSILPIDQFGKGIVLACVEVPAAQTVQEITDRSGCNPFLYVTVRRAMRDVIDEAIKRRVGRTVHGPRGTVSTQQPEPVPDSEAELPPLDLPRISLQLDASASGVAASQTGSAPPQGAAQQNVALPKRPHIQKFGSGVLSAPAVPTASVAVGANSPRPEELAKPKLGPRPAPVLPPQPAAAKAAPPASQEWESIFDIGDEQVRRSKPDEAVKRKA